MMSTILPSFLTTSSTNSIVLKRLYVWGIFLVLGVWNALPGFMVKADVVEVFKRLLDRCLNSQREEGYGSGKGDYFNLYCTVLCSGASEHQD